MRTTRGTQSCESCAAESSGVRTPATTRSTNPDYAGLALCAECADEYDSRPSWGGGATTDEMAREERASDVMVSCDTSIPPWKAGRVANAKRMPGKEPSG